MKREQLQDLLQEGLEELYEATKLCRKLLQQCYRTTGDSRLKQSAFDRAEDTVIQLNRIKQILDTFGGRAGGRTTPLQSLADLVKNCLRREDDDEGVRNTELIILLQSVAHYQIALLGTYRTYAEQLGHDEAAELLQQSLDEMKDFDEELSEIASELISVDVDCLDSTEG